MLNDNKKDSLINKKLITRKNFKELVQLKLEKPSKIIIKKDVSLDQTPSSDTMKMEYSKYTNPKEIKN